MTMYYYIHPFPRTHEMNCKNRAFFVFLHCFSCHSNLAVMNLKAEMTQASTQIKTAEMKLKHDTQVS